MPRPEDLPPPDASPDEIRATADEVLSRSEFQEPPRTIWERIVDWVNEAINEAIATLFTGTRSVVVAFLILALVAGAVAFLLYRIIRGAQPRRVERGGATIDVERRRPATDWEEDARAHAEAGEWREALRCRYRALLARLAAAGTVDEIPGRTAGEYRLDVRRSKPEAAPPFSDATDLFERVWYGGRDAGAEGDAAFRELADRVRSKVDT